MNSTPSLRVVPQNEPAFVRPNYNELRIKLFAGVWGRKKTKRMDVVCPMTDTAAAVLHVLRIRRPLYAQGVVYR